MKRFALAAAGLAWLATGALAAPTDIEGRPSPKRSGFLDFLDATAEFSPGIGQVTATTCGVGAATQPAPYAGNFLVDCDGEVPHNETTVAVDPADPRHAVGGFHSYHLAPVGNHALLRVVAAASVTSDGGVTWREVTPPISPYQFSGDPALAFDASGRLYYANIADHEGPGGSFTAPSVIVATSDDGGLTWAGPVTVASGHGAVTSGAVGQLVFQDKDYLAVDAGASSPFQNRAHVTWTSFQQDKASFRSPITTSHSDGGQVWSAPQEVSGFGSFCVATISGRPNECDLNQDSYPTVAPNGRVYVSFENFNTPAENQILVVRSDNGGQSFSAPVKVADVFDINYPENADRRATLTGCQFRVGSVANSAADPGDPRGHTVYVVWSDNRRGTVSATDADVFLARSTDGGATWTTYTVDDSGNDQFFPWVAVGPGGRVDVGYMDRFPSAGQGECRYGFTLSRLAFDERGKMTLVDRRRLDTGLSDPGHSRWFSASTAGNGRFIGDYNGVAVGADGATWSLWTDQRGLVATPPSSLRTHGQHAVGVRTPP